MDFKGEIGLRSCTRRLSGIQERIRVGFGRGGSLQISSLGAVVYGHLDFE